MHFARSFRARTGLSPHHYVLRGRIEVAQEPDERELRHAGRGLDGWIPHARAFRFGVQEIHGLAPALMAAAPVGALPR